MNARRFWNGRAVVGWRKRGAVNLFRGRTGAMAISISPGALSRAISESALQCPIVLRYFRFTSAEDMYLDVRSCERATKAVVFFDRYLKRSIARVTHAAIVNRLFAYTTGGLPELEGFFAPDTITEINGEA